MGMFLTFLWCLRFESWPRASEVMKAEHRVDKRPWGSSLPPGCSNSEEQTGSYVDSTVWLWLESFKWMSSFDCVHFDDCFYIPCIKCRLSRVGPLTGERPSLPPESAQCGGSWGGRVPGARCLPSNSAIHRLVLPHGDTNQKRCPSHLAPTQTTCISICQSKVAQKSHLPSQPAHGIVMLLPTGQSFVILMTLLSFNY